MPFPWRNYRCWCQKLGTMNYQGTWYCTQHYPYREHALELNAILFDLVGKERRDAYIDEWFPTDESFGWAKFLDKLEEIIPKLSMETGLLTLDKNRIVW
jgi:hypothetical protein